MKKYLALLRGINVGGNRKVGMAQLKQVFEETGMHHVKTYINSGNVIFQCPSTPTTQLTNQLESAIVTAFGFNVNLLIKTQSEVDLIIQHLPTSWNNDAQEKTDVLFLWKEIDNPNILNQVNPKPEIDEVRYVPGALLWRVSRTHIGRSSLRKIIGTGIYKQMTVRNCNTTRKLHQLMQD